MILMATLLVSLILWMRSVYTHVHVKTPKHLLCFLSLCIGLLVCGHVVIAVYNLNSFSFNYMRYCCCVKHVKFHISKPSLLHAHLCSYKYIHVESLTMEARYKFPDKLEPPIERFVCGFGRYKTIVAHFHIAGFYNSNQVYTVLCLLSV